MHLSGVKIHFRPHRILSMVQVVYLPRFVRMHVEHSLDLRWFTVAERSFSPARVLRRMIFSPHAVAIR